MNSRTLRSLSALGITLVVLLQIAAAPAPVRLRVLSYNIHHAEGVDGKLDLERIAGIIRAVKPDMVALQEVDRVTRRSNQVDQPAELARLTKMHVAFGRNIPYEGGEYGNAVLSRRPILRHKNHSLPSFGPGEKRGVLAVEVELEGGQSLLFLATHLDHRPAEREREASAIAINKLAAESSVPAAILAGDLNAIPTSNTLTAFKQNWTMANAEPLLTSPAINPRRQIDYVLLRPASAWKVIDVTVLDEPVASDHRPLLATLEFAP